MRTRVSARPLVAETSWTWDSHRLVFTFVSSNRANTWPSWTRTPSSTSTSTTLPVTFEDTVALRLAVTYPDAFKTVWSLPTASLARTSAVWTLMTLAPLSHQAEAAASTNNKRRINPNQPRELASGLRSMRKSSNDGLD